MILYKFFKSEYGLDSLFNKNIKLTTLDEINDPYELKGIKLDDGGVSSLYDPHDLFSETLFACFSKSYKDPIMWSHYADFHRGIVVGYEYLGKGEVIDVVYSDKKIDIFRLDVNENPSYFRKNLAKIKYGKWSYEDEARILFSKDDVDPVLIGGNKKYFISNLDSGLEPKEVIFGSKFNIKKNGLFNEILWSELEQYRAILDDQCFEVRRDKIYL